MTRGPVLVRDAAVGDAAALLEIWHDFTSDAERPARELTSVEEVQSALLRLETDPAERLVVAELDGVAVGVAHFRRAPISPIHSEDAVHVSHVHVMSECRRRGIGKQLLEEAADWADEKDTLHLVAAVAASARESNRFFARLGLTQVAVMRATTVASLRSKLATPTTKRTVATNVIAARRLMRRPRTSS